MNVKTHGVTIISGIAVGVAGLLLAIVAVVVLVCFLRR